MQFKQYTKLDGNQVSALLRQSNVCKIVEITAFGILKIIFKDISIVQRND